MSQEEITRTKTDRKVQEQNVSVYAYDLAVAEDLRARFKQAGERKKVNTTVQITSPENAFNILGTLNEDTAIMPFISLSREGWQLNLDRQRFSNLYWSRSS